MEQRKYHRICDLLWVFISIMIIVASIQLKLNSPSGVGPGFIMFGSGILLLFFSLIGLLKGIDEKKKVGLWAGPYWKRVIIVIISLFGYALILNKLGYILSTFLLMSFTFWTTGQEHRKWMVVIIKAVLSAGVTYLVFDKWLDCQLPKGIFSF